RGHPRAHRHRGVLRGDDLQGRPWGCAARAAPRERSHTAHHGVPQLWFCRRARPPPELAARRPQYRSNALTASTAEASTTGVCLSRISALRSGTAVHTQATSLRLFRLIGTPLPSIL